VNRLRVISGANFLDGKPTHLQRPVKPLLTLLPPEVHMGTLERSHIEALLPEMGRLSDYQAYRSLLDTKRMVEYMSTSPAWAGLRPSRFLIWDDDPPRLPQTLPRPIPPQVLDQLDPDDHDRNGCLDEDSDGYWWIRIHHQHSKMGRDHRIPTRMSDGVIDAIRRQCERVKHLPDHFGEHYLFRTEKGVLAKATIDRALTKLARHLKYEELPYTITPHQFRHTIATDMIEQGVDIYTVKEFLGHSSLSMTERYVKVYLTSLKAKYDAYRVKKQQTAASEMMTNRIQVNNDAGEADGGWAEGRVGKLYVSPLPDGIGNCAHLAMLDPCPTPPHCPTCPQLRANKRHLPVWENKAQNLLITVEALRANPAYARARQKHEQEMQHAEKVIKTIQEEGFWDGRIHNS
jgi:hypothetical protein